MEGKNFWRIIRLAFFLCLILVNVLGEETGKTRAVAEDKNEIQEQSGIFRSWYPIKPNFMAKKGTANVYGLRTNLPYGKDGKVIGGDIGIVNLCNDDMYGVSLGAWTEAEGNLGGISVSPIYNFSRDSKYGLFSSLYNSSHKNIVGISISSCNVAGSSEYTALYLDGILVSESRPTTGSLIGLSIGYSNVSTEDIKGLSLGVLKNSAGQDIMGVSICGWRTLSRSSRNGDEHQWFWDIVKLYDETPGFTDASDPSEGLKMLMAPRKTFIQSLIDQGYIEYDLEKLPSKEHLQLIKEQYLSLPEVDIKNAYKIWFEVYAREVYWKGLFINGFGISGKYLEMQGLFISGLTGNCGSNMRGIFISGEGGNLFDMVGHVIFISGLCGNHGGDMKGFFISGIGSNHGHDGPVFAIDGFLDYPNYRWSNNMDGIFISGLRNVGRDGKGLFISGVANKNRKVKGSQLSLGYNNAQSLKGLQIGTINKAKELDHGLQIGLLNFADNGILPVFPLFNFNFASKKDQKQE